MNFFSRKKHEQQLAGEQAISGHIAASIVKDETQLEFPADELLTPDALAHSDELSTSEPELEPPDAQPAPERTITFDIVNSLEQPSVDEQKICNVILPKPLDTVAITTQTELSDNKEVLHVLGHIKFPMTEGLKKPAEDIFKRTRKVYRQRADEGDLSFTELGDKAFATTGPSGTTFAISRARESYDDHSLYVTTSYVPSGYNERVTAVEAPQYSKKQYQNSLKDITDGIETVLNLTVERADKPVEPTSIKIRTAKSSEAKADTPDNIKDEFGAERPKVTFEEIGGQEEAKREIEGLALAFANPETYRYYGTQPPKGVLLYGPPGTGKTLAAKALASEADAAFYTITPTDVTSMWYGDSEKRMQRIFDVAAAEERSIVYFDEIDAITPVRDGAHEASQRVMSVILQNLDGMGSKDNVMVVASTNRLDAIDQAMRRPGRFDRIVEMGLPEESDRQDICAIHVTKANGIAKRELFDTTIDWKHIAAGSEGMSGAELAEIIRRSLEKKARAHATTGEEQPLVTEQEVMDELRSFQKERHSAKPHTDAS